MTRPRLPHSVFVCLLLALTAGSSGCGTRPAIETRVIPEHVATTPVPNEGMAERTAQLTERAAAATDARLVFLGDSITQSWDAGGAEVWQARYAPLHALNLGVSGDRTEHVLQRLHDGQLDGLSPQLVVLMIGTNNTAAGQTPEQIADGVAAILQQLVARLPDTRVLLLAVFPRGPDADDPGRLKNAAVNALIAPLADGERIVFLDIGDAFLAPDGTLSPEIMPDLLHLSPRGYALWAEAMAPTLTGMLGE